MGTLRLDTTLQPRGPAAAANAGERPSAYGDHYFRTAPRLECGDARYEWVNRARSRCLDGCARFNGSWQALATDETQACAPKRSPLALRLLLS
jgi:hypothetical protein